MTSVRQLAGADRLTHTIPRSRRAGSPAVGPRGFPWQQIGESRCRYYRPQPLQCRSAPVLLRSAPGPVDFHLNARLDISGDADRFLQSIGDRLRQLGFSDFAYQPLGDERHANDSRIAAPHGHFAGELRGLDGSDAIYGSILRQHAVAGGGLLLGSDLDNWLSVSPLEGGWRERYRRLKHRIDKLGYHDYGALVLKGRPPAILWVSSRDLPAVRARGKILDSRQKLESLGQQIHALAGQHFPVELGLQTTAPRLNGRPLRLLQVLAGSDITLAEAAERLHISVSTANQHIATAKRALGSRTTTHAIIAAARQGLIVL